MIGMVRSDIASVGSITSVRNAIAAVSEANSKESFYNPGKKEDQQQQKSRLDRPMAKMTRALACSSLWLIRLFNHRHTQIKQFQPLHLARGAFWQIFEKMNHVG